MPCKQCCKGSNCTLRVKPGWSVVRRLGKHRAAQSSTMIQNRAAKNACSGSSPRNSWIQLRYASLQLPVLPCGPVIMSKDVRLYA
jgi:hypothetical protein